MSEELEQRRGCFGRLTVLFVVVLLGGFAAALYFIAQPQNLDDVAGYRMRESGRTRNLQRVLENSIQREYPVTISEAEINRYLRATLKAHQGGLLSKWVEIRGVAVRLEDGRAEIITERRIADRTFTDSMYLSVEVTEDEKGLKKTLHLHGGPYLERVPFLNRGGRFGQLVMPQGFLILVLDSYRQLGDLYKRELDLAFGQMARIRIEKGKIVLDPRPPGGTMGLEEF